MTALTFTSIMVACGSDKKSSAGGGAGSAGGPFNSGGSAGANGSTASGFDAIWKRASADLTHLNTETPTAAPTTKTAEFPATYTDPSDGRQFEAYHQFKDDKLVTYAYFVGDSAYFRISQAAIKSDDMYIVQTGAASHLYSMKDGKLVASSTEAFGTSILYTDAIYAKHEGAFPPPTWPTRVIETVVPEVAQ